MIISDDELERTARLVTELGVRGAALELGLAHSTVSHRMARYHQRGLGGQAEHAAMPLPEGFTLAGVSSLVDGQGNVRAQWIKSRAERTVEDAVDALKAAFDRYEGRAGVAPPPEMTNWDLATIYMIGDHHLGMYAWARETGNNYDLGIAERILMNAMNTLVASSPPSRWGVVLNLGDFFHSDSDENRTRHSGAVLDVDTRYAKVLELGVQMLVRAIDLALQKHQEVIVVNLPGNHDPYGSLALAAALSAFYHDDPRVHAELDPSPFWQWTFGRVMLAATHGDKVKPEQMSGVMAAKWPREWGKADYRYAYFGHVHHRSRGGGEQAGVIWETFGTLAAKDAWHSGHGYTAQRTMTAVTLHKDWGEVSRNIVSVRTEPDGRIHQRAAESL